MSKLITFAQHIKDKNYVLGIKATIITTTSPVQSVGIGKLNNVINIGMAVLANNRMLIMVS